MPLTVILPDYENDSRYHPATVWLIENLGPCINDGDPSFRGRYYGDDWLVQPASPVLLFTIDSSIPVNLALSYTLSERVPEFLKVEFVLRFK